MSNANPTLEKHPETRERHEPHQTREPHWLSFRSSPWHFLVPQWPPAAHLSQKDVLVPWALAVCFAFTGVSLNVHHHAWLLWTHCPWEIDAAADECRQVLGPAISGSRLAFLGIPDFLLLVWLVLSPLVITAGLNAQQEFRQTAASYGVRGSDASPGQALLRHPGALALSTLAACAVCLVGTEGLTWLRFLLVLAFFWYALVGLLSMRSAFRDINRFFDGLQATELDYHADRMCGLSFVRRFADQARIGVLTGVLAVPMGIALLDQAAHAIDAAPHGAWIRTFGWLRIAFVSVLFLVWAGVALLATFQDRVLIGRWVRRWQAGQLVALARAKRIALDTSGRYDEKEIARLTARESALLALSSARVGLTTAVADLKPILANAVAIAGILFSSGSTRSHVLETLQKVLS